MQSNRTRRDHVQFYLQACAFLVKMACFRSVGKTTIANNTVTVAPLPWLIREKYKVNLMQIKLLYLFAYFSVRYERQRNALFRQVC